ncbi:hypothetical protein K2173_015271 [Erythroxylum novogranatense]|uniref:C2H2-type domain-containing protein n=1 Tax=Erythroxylum novogranatense TaxID=1862640 RepID=A0AAV8T3A3_9ROSI|nr:hypothetical protein K2173_015271 [Erythroxylum novogranatense]
MKRSFHETELSMANCLMLLSQRSDPSFACYEAMRNSPSRVFECKTCNRQFSSFQALGGHRASHKKPRIVGRDGISESQSPAKPKTHECSICGLEFSIGQALGGHMNDQNLQTPSLSPPRDSHVVPVFKKSNSRRVLCLDLNFTPYENDLELFKLRTISTPMVDCFL